MKSFPVEESEIDLLKEVLEMIRDKQDKISPNLRYSKKKKVKTTMARVKKAIFIIKTENIADTNTLMRAAANEVTKCVNCTSK